MDADTAVAVLDGSPVAEGLSLVIPKRHIETLLDLPEAELPQVWSLVAEVWRALMKKHQPDGFNISVNERMAEAGWRS